MRRLREYAIATRIDADSIKVNLISVQDESSQAEMRILEVLDLCAQLIALASKRGRVKTEDKELVDEAA